MTHENVITEYLTVLYANVSSVPCSNWMEEAGVYNGTWRQRWKLLALHETI